MANPEWTEPEDWDDKELCGWCGEELDCFGMCDCPGAIEARGDSPEEPAT